MGRKHISEIMAEQEMEQRYPSAAELVTDGAYCVAAAKLYESGETRVLSVSPIVRTMSLAACLSLMLDEEIAKNADDKTVNLGVFKLSKVEVL
jgi:hypothetical protein